MKLLDIMTGPWAITPTKLEEIWGIYQTHLRGDQIDIKAIEARIGQPLQREEQGYSVINSVAVVPVHGVISKKMNLLSHISGGASTELIKRDIAAAMNDPAVQSIVLDMDSPGGSVDGTQELAQFIYGLRGEKPLAAVANGQMTSAAYWIGAACDKVYASSGTTIIGHIGVICQHTDTSKRDEANGVTKTTIYSGRYKNVGASDQPLSKEDHATIQDRTDYIYMVFVSDVSDFRGVSKDDTHRKMADGKIFFGEQAVEAGLADGVSTLDEVIEQMASGALPKTKKRIEENAMSEATYKDTLTLAVLRENHPDLVEALQKEGHAASFAQGATAETERVKAVFDASLPGHGALIQSLMFDGKSTGGEAATAVLTAERKLRTDAQANMQADANDLDNIEHAAGGEELAKTDLTTEEGRTAAWEANKDGLQASFNDDKGAFNAYYKNAKLHRTFKPGGNAQ